MFARMPFEVFLAIALMSCGKLAWSGGMMFPIVSALITVAAAQVVHRQRGTPAERQAACRTTPRRIPVPAPARGAASQSAPAGVHTPR
jgi:hypothetical protein